jgi:Fur family ferric uptake transcriptional regulator
MFEMDGCPGDLQSLVPRGFVMEDHEVFIYGRCRECGPTH